MRIFKLLAYFICLVLTVSVRLFAADWYVRPAGGNYEAENGTSYQNAWDGLTSVVWGPSGVKPGDTLWVCGLHVYTMSDPYHYFATEADISPLSGTSESARVIIRGDYSGDPGIVWGAYLPTFYTWTSVGGGTYSIELIGDHDIDGYFENITARSWTILEPKDSVAQCMATAGSHYSSSYNNGSTFYIHLTDGSNPAGKVYFPKYGYHFQVSDSQYITFYKLKIYYHERFIDTGTATHLRWDGCTMAYTDFKFWNNQHYMEILNCDMGWTGNGIYTISNNNNAPSNYRFAGNTIHDIGVRTRDQNSDAHGIGIQGGHDGIIEDNYLYNCGNTILLYAFRNQECKNNIVRRNFVRDSHTLGGTSGWGISTQCDNNSLSDKSGNKFYQNIVVNCSAGFRLQFEDEQEVYNNVAINCDTSFVSERSSGSIGPHIKARNNISYNPTYAHVEYASSDADRECDYDYNIYYPVGANMFVHNSANRTFAEWKSETGCDANSLISNPLFINGSGSYSRPEDFRVASNSPAIDKGVNVDLTQDRGGTGIPQGLAPDIGPYEYVKLISSRINASPNSGQVPLIVNFSGNASGDFPPFTFSWDFGEGQTSTAQNPSHTYSFPGAYTVILTVKDSKGHEDSVSATINAYRNGYFNLFLSAITGNPAPGEGGTTNPPPGNHSYIQGSSVQVNAVPYLDCRFSFWGGDVLDSEAYRETTNATIDRNKSLTANFCTRCGDVNGDLKITPIDAQRAFDIFLSKIPNPTVCEKENADVNCDGTKGAPKITPGDAQAIFDKYLGRSELPSNCSGNSRAATMSVNRLASLNTKIIINDVSANSGEQIAVPVIIDSPSGISAFGFDLVFPSNIFEFISLEKTPYSRDFRQLDAYEMASGILRVGGYKHRSATGDKSEFLAVLITLIFKIKNRGKSGEHGSISFLHTYDDLQNALIRNGMILAKPGENYRPNTKSPSKAKSTKTNPH